MAKTYKKMNCELMRIQLNGLLEERIISYDQMLGKIEEYIDEYGEDEFIMGYAHEVKKQFRS